MKMISHVTLLTCQGQLSADSFLDLISSASRLPTSAKYIVQ